MLGEKLTQVIESKGVKNRSSFAKNLGITPQLLYKYEKNIVEPSLEFILKFVNHFNLSLDSFLKDDTLIIEEQQINISNDLASLKESVADQIILKLTDVNDKSLTHIIDLGNALIKITEKVIQKI